ncbi:MAG: hypothetical protein C4K58_03435 [Flavobacteriaceae bacterium]|nr:MAG: hypothetical protein C4K58_03435 [Flavobacteriaceae bacterium]
MIQKVNLTIAKTHIVTGKKQTMVATLGVAIGVSIYLFISSLNVGLDDFYNDLVFKSNAHLKVKIPEEVSKELVGEKKDSVQVLLNPKLVSRSQNIVNPAAIEAKIRAYPFIKEATKTVDLQGQIVIGTTKETISITGMEPGIYQKMFGFQEYVIQGDAQNLETYPNGIIVGSGLAKKLKLKLDDIVNIQSFEGVSKTLKVVGIFKYKLPHLDDNLCYVKITTARNLLKKPANYANNIIANVFEFNDVDKYTPGLSQDLKPYIVEDWKTTFSNFFSEQEIRKRMLGAISWAILLVSGFGIYNILSSTIQQKINDISILKAIGFSGRDVIQIFLVESLIMGLMGIFFGLILGTGFIYIMTLMKVGEQSIPIDYVPYLYAKSALLGFLITLCAGYFPAKKAADIDPVKIFRK